MHPQRVPRARDSAQERDANMVYNVMGISEGPRLPEERQGRTGRHLWESQDVSPVPRREERVERMVRAGVIAHAK